MSWTNPKTNWSANTVDDVYVGDWFNYSDYNRIKNNLEFLRDLSITLYDEFSIENVGEDKTYRDFFYADEINAMEKNLETINSNTLNRPYGEAPVYLENGSTMDYKELNRLESAILDLYNRLMNQSKGRKTLAFHLGVTGRDF